MPQVEKFKTRLLEQRERLAKMIGRGRQNVADRPSFGVNEAWQTAPRQRASGFTPNSGDDELADSAADTYAMEFDLAMIERHRHHLAAIESALGRFEAGTYGTCIRCHQKIPAGRLDAIPETAYCVGCESDVEVLG